MTAPRRYRVGSLELVSVSDGFFALDGGAMFGVVPKPLWSRVTPADDRNWIRMGMRPLVVLGSSTMIIDAGVGQKMDAKSANIYGFDRAGSLDDSLADGTARRNQRDARHGGALARAPSSARAQLLRDVLSLRASVAHIAGDA